ncbi:MAG TPA: HAMP domain-containing sensor histidine kinase [Acidimicrobiales bacterium]|jgi:two-component system sensor histidine kinase BaeS|nr:HAMP domain-containing sensor histidine kinase [Acidimicrobiales bacterium]
MTRRITLTMVAVVAGALAVASVFTLLLARRDTRNRTRADLVRQAQRLATSIEDVNKPNVLRAVGAALRLEDQAVVSVGPAGPRPATLPRGVTSADLDVSRLRQGHTVSGDRGGLLFAAAPAGGAPAAPNVSLVVVVTRRPGGTRGVGPIVVVALVTLAVAAAIAASLGRRLTRPLRAARQATRRIAAGDLAARVPVNPAEGDDLVALAESINTMAAGLERSRGLERQFLLSVSHDLRTPLTSIRGYAEALAEGRAPDLPQAASVILVESRRLERLVADLLELAKLGTQRFSLEVRRTDVGEVLSETTAGFTPAAEGAGVSLSVAVPGQGTMVAAADPDRLAQVVANLVENAMKFARTAIAVGAEATAGRVRLWVDDDGPGIAEGDLARVFEPFFQSTRTPSRQVGTGLGLAIVHELVEAMGGTVQAAAGSGGGTRVVVSLPAWPG